jgi:hypothetical protein
MRYQQPYGITDTNAPYINGDPSIGRAGSIPPAAAFEYPMRELIAMIQQSGFVPTDSDLAQLLKATRSQYVNYTVDVGVANSLGGTFTPPLDSYTLGMPFRVRVSKVNTGPCTFDAGPGRHSIVHPDGSDLSPGDLPAGAIAELVWDGTRFQLVNWGGAGAGGGGVNNYTIKIPYVVDTSPTANAVVAPFSPAITTVAPGDPIEVKVMNIVTGPTQIYVNALPPVPIINRFGGPLRRFDIVTNEIVLLIYTGNSWQLVAQEPRTQTAIYSVPGNYNWVCPNGVFVIDVQVWGAGAGGFNFPIGVQAIAPGGSDGQGGSGGGYCRTFALPVTPGTSYPITVGAGGPQCYGHGGYNGGQSTFGSAGMTATGGAWGANSWGAEGQGYGGDINMRGQPGWLMLVTTGSYNWYGAYGWGGSAPHGGMGQGEGIGGQWPGGGGGGGNYYGAVGSVPSGAGGHGGVIIQY